MAKLIKQNPISGDLMRWQRNFCLGNHGFALLLCLLLLPLPAPLVRAQSSQGSAPAGAASSSPAQSVQDSRPLEPRSPIERQLAGGEAHSYQMSIEAGQYLHVIVEQRGITVGVTLFGPDGKELAKSYKIYEQQGPVPVSLIASAAGSYRLEVVPTKKEALPGRYEVRIEEQRTATAPDKDRVAAERAFMEGRQLQSQDTAEPQRQAIKKYVVALPLFRALGDRYWEANTLNSIGLAYWSLEEHQKGLDYLNQTLPLRRAVGDRLGEASTLNGIGLVYKSLGKYQKAIDYLSQALPLRRAVGDRFGEGNGLNNIGTVYWALGDREKALDYYNQVLPIRRQLGDRQGEAITLNNIGLAYWAMDDLQKALDYYNQALPIAQKLSDRAGQAETLESIGLAYWSLGEPRKALDYYNQALPLKQELDERTAQANTLNSIGLAYWSLHDRKALDYYNQALLLMREVSDRSGEASTLSNIGTFYYDMDEKLKALDYYNQALKLARAVLLRSQEAITLSKIGKVYYDLGEKQKALDYYNQALQLARGVGNRSREALTLYGIATVERDRGNFQEALTQIEAAIKIIESVRNKISRRELRTSYFATVQDYYKLHIDLLMQLHKSSPSSGYDALALQTSERARARSLLEILTEGHVDIRSGVDPKLLEQERILKQQLITKQGERVNLLSDDQHTSAQEAAIQQEIETLLDQYQKVEAQIKAKSPGYAALTQPQPLTLQQIQSTLLNDNTLLLEYSLGKERSYLWAVTKTGIASYELPKAADIEAAAKRFLLLVMKPNASKEDVSQATDTLSQMLLKPVAEQLGQKRLLVVSDGALQYVPFAALAVDGKSAPNEGQLPLIIEHEIVNLPSASTLAVLKSQQAGRSGASKALAVLADPVFSRDDERVKKVGEPENTGHRETQDSALSTGTEELTRSADESGVTTFNRLPSTRQEAEQILALVPATDREPALDFEANRAKATSPDLAKYRIVHFATHGLLNSVHPELSGVVLSLVDKKGQSQDGFLRLQDIYNLNLPAELVVLSACQSGLGQEIKGEGLVGLTQGFMYAGAKRVVVSLWNVNDEATADLMARFYRGILKEKLQPAAALRAAQVEMWKQTQWKAPYYWAAFTLIGDAETPFMLESNPWAIFNSAWVALPVGVGAIALLVGTGAIALKLRRSKGLNPIPVPSTVASFGQSTLDTIIAFPRRLSGRSTPVAGSEQSTRGAIAKSRTKWLVGGTLLLVGLGTSAVFLIWLWQPLLGTYDRPTYGIKLKYPLNWTKQEPSDLITGTLVNFLSPPESPTDRFQEKLIITVKDLSAKPLTLAEYSDLSIKEIKQFLPEANILSPISATTLANNPANQVIYTGKDGQHRLQRLQVWTIKNNKAYVITYEAEIGKYSQFSKTVREIMNSLEIQDSE